MRTVPAEEEMSSCATFSATAACICFCHACLCSLDQSSCWLTPATELRVDSLLFRVERSITQVRLAAYGPSSKCCTHLFLSLNLSTPNFEDMLCMLAETIPADCLVVCSSWHEPFFSRVWPEPDRSSSEKLSCQHCITHIYCQRSLLGTLWPCPCCGTCCWMRRRSGFQ